MAAFISGVGFFLEFLVVGAFDVDGPDIMLFAQDVARGQHRRQHRMVLVVVAVQAVAADRLEVIVERDDPLFQHVKRGAVFAVIDRITLGWRMMAAPMTSLALARPSCSSSLLTKLARVLVRHVPQPVALLAEIFMPMEAVFWSGSISFDQARKFWIRPTFTAGEWM
ncbi:MAG: hypothetical protein R3D61_09625 [Defluviimonas denitrificans]